VIAACGAGIYFLSSMFFKVKPSFTDSLKGSARGAMLKKPLILYGLLMAAYLILTLLLSFSNSGSTFFTLLVLGLNLVVPLVQVIILKSALVNKHLDATSDTDNFLIKKITDVSFSDAISKFETQILLLVFCIVIGLSRMMYDNAVVMGSYTTFTF
jgi:hypothetical protein